MTKEINPFTKIRTNIHFKSVSGGINFAVATDGKEVYYFGRPNVLCKEEYATSQPFKLDKKAAKLSIKEKSLLVSDLVVSCGVRFNYFRTTR